MSEPLVCPDCKHAVDEHDKERQPTQTFYCFESVVKYKSLHGVRNYGPCQCSNSGEELREYFAESEERDDRN